MTRLTSILILFLLFSIESRGQHSWRSGLVPQINANYKLGKSWKINAKTENRIRLASGTFGKEKTTEYQYERTDLSLIISYKTGLNTNAAIGQLIRFRGEKILHRSIQQFSVVQRLSGLKLAHRFSTDQTWAKEEKPVYRFRYRLASEFPLNGQKTDPREFYIKLSNEYLYISSFAFDDFEIRLSPILGYALTNNNKLEVGLDYRIDSFRLTYNRSSFWTRVSWYVSF
ncbi:MAG: DUF2490 domain-containing protein [Bacteroidetes bacterium]|nr:DUF2490 domain-containing protein [Bacteroidota bacterium]